MTKLKDNIIGYVGLIYESSNMLIGKPQLLHIRDTDNTLWYGGGRNIKVAVFRTRKECSNALSNFKVHRKKSGYIIDSTFTKPLRFVNSYTTVKPKKKELRNDDS
jgi:hypothetical protein